MTESDAPDPAADQPPGATPAASGAKRRRPTRLAGVVAGLTVVNALPAFTGLVTAPLQARALGVEGRGTLAAIVVPLSMAPALLNLGVMQYAGKEAARRRPLAPLIGSLGAVYLVIGLIGIALAVPAARFLADGRHTVETFLVIGFCLLPVSLLGQLLVAVNSGLQRWRRVIVAQLIPAVATLVGIVALYVTANLTVTSAAIVVVGGSLAAVLPLTAVLGEAGRLRIDRRLIREGIPFGLKAWVGTTASYANVRIDQLAMVRLVSERQLGLYVVAVTIASVSGILASAVAGATNPRVAQGEDTLPARALRVVLFTVGLMHLALAALTPLILRVLFGPDFADVAPIAWVLLAAGLPLSGVTILSNALVSAGRPALSAYGEGIALLITIPGLVILLPMLGALGAAIVSLAAYTANFAFLLTRARRRFGGPLGTFLIPGRSDWRWALALIRSRGGESSESA